MREVTNWRPAVNAFCARYLATATRCKCSGSVSASKMWAGRTSSADCDPIMGVCGGAPSSEIRDGSSPETANISALAFERKTHSPHCATASIAFRMCGTIYCSLYHFLSFTLVFGANFHEIDMSTDRFSTIALTLLFGHLTTALHVGLPCVTGWYVKPYTHSRSEIIVV